MGSVFGFVSSDLKQKIEVLVELMGKDEQNYITIKSMIAYEKEHNILDKGNHINGARTLLRLHRGLGTVPGESVSVQRQWLPRILTL